MTSLRLLACSIVLTSASAYGQIAQAQSEPTSSEHSQQIKAFQLPHGEGNTSDACVWDLTQKLRSEIFTDEYQLGSTLHYRVGLENWKYWIKVEPTPTSMKQDSFYLTFRAMWNAKNANENTCEVDQSAINPLYVSDMSGQTILAASGMYANRTEKFGDNFVGAGLYVIFKGYEILGGFSPDRGYSGIFR